MVISCIAKGCENKQRRYTNTMFHRIPTNVKRRSLWLAALGIPPTTPVEKINSCRVCEEHFTSEDYVEKMQYCSSLTKNARKMVLRLKDSAIPSIFKTQGRSASSDTDSMMSDICIIQGCNGTEELLSFPKDPSTLQQWMLCLDGRLKHPVNSSSKVCSAHFTSDSSAYWQENHSSVAANLILKTGALPSHVDNEQVEPCPQERTSAEHEQTWLIEDTGLTRSTLPHTQSTESNRSSSNMQERDDLMSDIVVKLACLLQLFQKCLKCCSDACSISTRRKGPILHVVQQCWSCGNTRDWTSQPPSDTTNSLEELVVTSKDMEGEITINIKEEEEEEEQAVTEGEYKVMEEIEMDEEAEEVDMEEDMEEEAEVKEEEGELTEEEEEKKNQKLRKRKRRVRDGEWAPDDGVVMETSDEESEAEEEEEEEEERRPHRWTWCCDCGVRANTGCSRQKHLVVYCCRLCDYRDLTQEPKNSELLETQRISSPETPSAGHQEGTDDDGQSAESSCNPEENDNNKPADSSDGPEDPNSITSHINSGVDASTCSRDHHSEEVSYNNHQQSSTTNQDKQNLPNAVYFKDLRSLQSHMRRSHRGKRHLCPDCGVLCHIRDGKTSHVCEHKVRPFPCSICRRRFRSDAQLQLHLQFHDEDFTTKCKYCHETFKKKEDKERHEETHIGESLKYRCPECPKRFANINTRRAHLSTAHLNRGRFVCKICDKSFHIEFKLKRHEVVHTGLKPFRCDQCNRSFNQPGHLKSHMRVHTGERPFMCHECGQCFNHNVSLKNHVQRKHRSAPDDDDDEYRGDV